MTAINKNRCNDFCYECTHKETERQAIKSKGVVLVFRMFRLDRCLPKERCGSRWESIFYMEIKAGYCMGV